MCQRVINMLRVYVASIGGGGPGGRRGGGILRCMYIYTHICVLTPEGRVACIPPVQPGRPGCLGCLPAPSQAPSEPGSLGLGPGRVSALGSLPLASFGALTLVRGTKVCNLTRVSPQELAAKRLY